MPKRVPHLDERLNRNRGVLHQIVVEPTQCQRDHISSIKRETHWMSPFGKSTTMVLPP